MKVYIVRHGEVLHNALKIYNNENEDLNENGVKQAEELKYKIKDLEFNVIILIDNRLEERNPGDLSGQPLEVTNREEYWNYYTEIQYGTSENIQEFFERVYSFLDELKTRDYESVLIVAHSGVSKVFSGYFEGIQDGKFLNRGLKNCEIKEYEL